MTAEKTVFVSSWLPFFSGFYESVAGSMIELQEYDFEYLQEQVDEKLDPGANPLKIDYDNTWEFFDQERQAMTDFSEKFLDVFNDEYQEKLAKIGISKVEFENLYSPKEYNFSTDVINTKYTINEKEFSKWYAKYSKKESFQENVKEEYTSCSGFISFHDNDSASEEWKIENVIQDEHKIGKIVEWYLSKKGEPNEEEFHCLEQDVEFYVMEYFDHDKFFESIQPAIDQHNLILDSKKRMQRKRRAKIIQSVA